MLISAWSGSGWEHNFIITLQKMSNGFTDFFFKAVTFLGDEMVFILVAALIYWCFDKKFGFRYMFCYIGAAVTVGVVKNFAARQRPFKYDGIKSIGAETHGYSFPSGHSQSAASQGTLLSQRFGNRKRWWVYLAAAVVTLLVMFSRMFLGQHFFTDVLTGMAVGIAVSLLLSFLFTLMGNKEEYFSLILIPILIVMMIVQGNGAYGALKDLYVVTAAYIAVSVGYLIEKKFINYDVKKACWWMQIVKFVFALGVALAIKEGLKAAFPKQNLIGDFIRYFLMALWASCGALAAFKYTGIFWNKKFPPKSPAKQAGVQSVTESAEEKTEQAAQVTGNGADGAAENNMQTGIQECDKSKTAGINAHSGTADGKPVTDERGARRASKNNNGQIKK